MEEYKKVIEINGVKLEVDLRNAKVIDNFRVGDTVKILKKEYNDKFKVCPGVIVSSENFKELPTIVVAYINNSYSTDLEFVYINEQSKDVEMVPADLKDLSIEKDYVLKNFDQKITTKHNEIIEIERKKKYFLDNFQRYFSDGKEDT